MLRWQARPPLRLQLSAKEWELLSDEHDIARGTWQANSLDQLVRELDALAIVGAPTKSTITITLHDGWVRSFIVEPPVHILSLAELKACAYARFESLFGSDGREWALRGTWNASRPFAVVAIPTTVLDSIERACTRHEWLLRSVQPMWARAMGDQTWPKHDQWWALTRDGSATVIRSDAGHIAHVRTTMLSDRAPQAALEKAVERERLRAFEPPHDDSAPNVWLELTSQRRGGQGIDALDFMLDDRPWAVPLKRRFWPAAVSLLAALMVSGTVIQEWLSAMREYADVQSRVAARQRAAFMKPPSQPATTLTSVQIESINRAVHQLNMPWPAIFRGLEVATPADIELLSLEPDSRQGRIRGTARTHDEHAIFQYLANLIRTSPFVDARLLSHEAQGRDATHAFKFQFEVVLRTADGQKDKSQ